MSTLFLDPPSKRMEDERYISVESPQQLAAWFEENPGCVEWCRKDDENRKELLETAAEVQGGGKQLADALERLFDEGGRGGVEAEEFAGAVCRVLAGVPGVGEGIAEKWRMERAAKEEAERLRAEAEHRRQQENEQRRREEADRRQDEEAERRRGEEEERLLKTPGRVMTLTLPGGATMEMVWCPPGSFMMGSPEGEEGHQIDEAQHQVTLTKGFWMGKYPVTQAQWKSVMGSNPSNFKGDNLPVERVSWWNCQKFVQMLNSRHPQEGMRWALPTEAQWEYACRAGSATAYFWGNVLNGDKANCNGNYPCGTTVKGPDKRNTTPVGSYAPNAWGLYDMLGNVRECCADWYDDYPGGAVTDPTGPRSVWNRVFSGGCLGRVFRGGSWRSYARHCRSASRNLDGMAVHYDDLGLRVVLLQVQ